MHGMITGTQRESVENSIKENIELNEGRIVGCLFFFVSRGDGDGLCERRVETGASREDRVCDGQIDRKEWGKFSWAYRNIKG